MRTNIEFVNLGAKNEIISYVTFHPHCKLEEILDGASKREIKYCGVFGYAATIKDLVNKEILEDELSEKGITYVVKGGYEKLWQLLENS